MSINEKEKDINEIFDDIALFEENVIEQAFEEGYKIGVEQGNIEGYHLGFHRGAEIGAELGFYLGVVKQYLEYYSKFPETSEKVIGYLNDLQTLILEYPKVNSEDCDLINLLSNIRSKYKRVCALMKVNILFPEKSNLNF